MTEQESTIETVNDELTEIEGQFSDVARKKIYLLERKIKALDALLKERDHAIEQVRVLRVLVSEPATGKSQPRLPLASQNVVSGEFADMYVWEAVEVILRRERKALTTREIVDRLVAGGKELNSTNQASQVHTSIRNKTDVFYSSKDAGKRTWGLVEWKKDHNEQETGD